MLGGLLKNLTLEAGLEGVIIYFNQIVKRY
jgi:hypothetical protein